MSDETNRPGDGGRFINLWELFSQIAKAEAIYDYEAAREITSCLSIDPIGMDFLRWRDELGILCPVGIDGRLRLLQLLDLYGSHATLFDADAKPTFERFGFYASDIYPFLARHDVAVPCVGDDDALIRTFSDGRRIPDWILAYGGQVWIPCGRAVGILTTSTVDAERYSPDYDEVFNRWGRALSDAVERGAIGMKTVSGKQMLVHADVRAWIAQHGHVWPLEAPVSQPANALSAVSSPDPQVAIGNLPPAGLSDPLGKLGKRRRPQIEMIMEVADSLGYQRQQIPDHGKQAIHKECHSRAPRLFTENKDTFDDIWGVALMVKAVRMAKHDLYARRV